MYNFMTSQQLSFLLACYPIDAYKRFSALQAEIANKIASEGISLDSLKQRFSEMLNLHRICLALSQVHNQDAIHVLESHEYWLNRGEDLENIKQAQILPEFSDIATWQRTEGEALLFQSFRLLPPAEEGIVQKLVLAEKLRKVQWNSIAVKILLAAVSEREMGLPEVAELAKKAEMLPVCESNSESLWSGTMRQHLRCWLCYKAGSLGWLSKKAHGALHKALAVMAKRIDFAREFLPFERSFVDACACIHNASAEQNIPVKIRFTLKDEALVEFTEEMAPKVRKILNRSGNALEFCADRRITKPIENIVECGSRPLRHRNCTAHMFRICISEPLSDLEFEACNLHAKALEFFTEQYSEQFSIEKTSEAAAQLGKVNDEIQKLRLHLATYFHIRLATDSNKLLPH